MKPNEMEYRADPKAEIWHFCRSCSKWPRGGRVSVMWLNKPPKLLELCDECFTLAATGTPTTHCRPVFPGVYGLTGESDDDGVSERFG